MANRSLSVIVCSLNPKPDYLGRVLEALRAQTLPRDEWEVIFVDNGSSERLSEAWDLTWHPHHLHVRENEVGLTPARIRGIREAAGALLVFVDDDNVIAPDYLRRALEIRRDNPQLAVFGAGVLEAEFETEPREEFRPLLRLLGLRSVSEPIWSNNPKDSDSIPWGAGLCVSRAAAEAYVQLVGRMRIGHLLDRRGSHLFCGGDDLFSWVAARNGSGFGIFPSLRIEHLIRSSRLRERYLFRLVHDHAFSHAVLRYAMCGEEQPRAQLVDTVRILLHGLRRGRFSMRFHWSATRGASDAATTIRSQKVRPLDSFPAGHELSPPRPRRLGASVSGSFPREIS